MELYRFDTVTDTLPNGERRCDSRYKDYDEQIEDIERARCTRPAALRVRVTPATMVSAGGSGNAAYTPLPNKVFEATSCRQCYERASLTQGQTGYEAKIEALAELPDPGPNCVFMTPEQIAKVKL
jgi:hypothetical protein